MTVTPVRVVKPYFEELREKAEAAAGGSGWDTRKRKSEFLQRASIPIANLKGNSRVLGCIIDAPRLAT